MSSSSIIPLATTVFASIFTLDVLYRYLSLRELLCGLFVVLLVLTLIIHSGLDRILFEKRSDGRSSVRQKFIKRYFDFIVNVIQAITIRVAFDFASATTAKMHMDWEESLYVIMIMLNLIFCFVIDK